MSDYTPSRDELIAAATSDNPYGSMEEAEVRRAIAKVEADALRKGAARILTHPPIDRYGRVMLGARAAAKQMDAEADRIEKEAGIER